MPVQTIQTATDDYPFTATHMMYVTSKDGQRRAAMPYTDKTFAQCFHGRFAWGNRAAILRDGEIETYPVMSEAEGLLWLFDDSVEQQRQTLNRPGVTPKIVREWEVVWAKRRAKLVAESPAADRSPLLAAA